MKGVPFPTLNIKGAPLKNHYVCLAAFSVEHASKEDAMRAADAAAAVVEWEGEDADSDA